MIFRSDFNAIAQGYSVDVLAEFIASKGIENYMVEIGGEVRAKGLNAKGELWKIGIDKPISIEEGRELQAVIALQDKSIATSGNYRKFYEKDGIKYSHTINPKTGYPVNHSLLSATVLANDCATADAYVWTGSSEDGTLYGASYHCLGWSTADGGSQARAGYSMRTDLYWSSLNLPYCNTSKSLYCFEQ